MNFLFYSSKKWTNQLQPISNVQISNWNVPIFPSFESWGIIKISRESFYFDPICFKQSTILKKLTRWRIYSQLLFDLIWPIFSWLQNKILLFQVELYLQVFVHFIFDTINQSNWHFIISFGAEFKTSQINKALKFENFLFFHLSYPE